jgi:hypothetical protein
LVSLKKIRILCYDSIEVEQKSNHKSSQPADKDNFQSPAGQFIRTMTEKAVEDFGERSDSINFSPNSLITIETGLWISNSKPHQK